MIETTGLEYFPFAVDFFEDDKIALVEAEFGLKGSAIAVRLLCKIYASEGYFYRWGRAECQLLAKRAGADISPRLVEEVVMGLVRCSFFDKGVFDQFGILTSRGIQMRFFEAVRRRKSVKVIREILLVDTGRYPNLVYDGRDSGDYITEATKDEAWMKAMCQLHGLSREKLLERIGQFALECACRVKCHVSADDAKRHISDWIKRQKNGREKQQKSGSNQEIATDTSEFKERF